jgi:hypothetical protein
MYDIETLQEFFLVTVYVPDEGKWYEFSVNKWENQLTSFIRFTEKYSEHHWVGYNSLRFDSQVVEWVMRNHEQWHELSGLEIAAKIAQKAQDVIHDANYELLPEFSEKQLSLRQIDLFKMAHFDNKNRRVSLKRLEFEMDMENIEEMPIHHAKKDLTQDDVAVIKGYCRNDVLATYEFYKILRGDTSHPLYKGNDQFQLRWDIEQEFGIPCINYSDSKIGDEMVKKFYCQEKGIEYSQLPKKGTFRKKVEVRNCIAKHVRFETPQLKEFLENIKKESLGMDDDFKHEVSFYGNVYSFMKGGLHTENKPEMIEVDDEHEIIDWDVTSYYPATIINNKKYPVHLGKEFLAGYEQMFNKRIELKPLAKKDSRIKGIVGALKLAVNSVYGKSSEITSWLYDRQLTMFTTITGELSLMMLIEKYETNGIKVMSANTDGVTIMIHKSLIPLMERINKWWMDTTKYELERTDYRKIIFSTVNDYIAIKTDGEVKKKGDFVTDFELHKNKSGRIVPIALENYFVHNIPVADTIAKHDNVFDFAIRQKASKDFHYEGMDRKNGHVNIYNKLIRYFVSLRGEKLMKVKNQDSKSTAPERSQVEAGEWLCTVCNHLTKDHPMDNINKAYYIEKAEKMIRKIETNGRKTNVYVNPQQLSLW